MKTLNTAGLTVLSLLLAGHTSSTLASTNLTQDQFNQFDGQSLTLSNIEKYGRGEDVIGYNNCAFVIDGNGELSAPQRTKVGFSLVCDESLVGCLHITYGDPYEMTDLYLLDQPCVSAKPDVCVEGKPVAVRIRSYADTDIPAAEAQLVVERTYQVHSAAIEQLGSTTKKTAKSVQTSLTSARMKTMLTSVTE